MNNEVQYSWKYGNKFDANMVGREFAAIEQRDGTLTKEAIVEAARPENAPMHDMFEWDDAVAGELYRKDQAGYYVRNLEVEIVAVGNSNGKTVTTRAYMNVTPVSENTPEGKGTFINTRRAIEQPDIRQIVLDRAKHDMRIFRDKYNDLREVMPVIVSIDQVMMEI